MNLQFQKRTDDGYATCTIELFEDKSVYVCGDEDEIEVIFEFAPGNLEKAIKYVQGLGYQQQETDA